MDDLAEALAKAQYEGVALHAGRRVTWDDENTVIRDSYLGQARRILAWLDEHGRLVPDGYRAETEYATYWVGPSGTVVGRPFPTRDIAEQKRRDDEHIVVRRILAGPCRSRLVRVRRLDCAGCVSRLGRAVNTSRSSFVDLATPA